MKYIARVFLDSYVKTYECNAANAKFFEAIGAYSTLILFLVLTFLAGFLSHAKGAFDEAEEHLTVALTYHTTLGNEFSSATAANQLGNCARERGEYHICYFGLLLFFTTRSLLLQFFYVFLTCWKNLMEQRYNRAESLHQTALEIFSKAESPWGIALAQNNLVYFISKFYLHLFLTLSSGRSCKGKGRMG